MPCPNCPGPVPVVSQSLAQKLISQIPETKRPGILIATFEWLTRKDEGLTIYEGINGRPYTDREKDIIAMEHGIVAELPCPYHTPNGCMLGGLGPHYNRIEETGKAPYGWLPTLVAKFLDRRTLLELARKRQIADAKISLLTRNEWFLTREMLSITT